MFIHSVLKKYFQKRVPVATLRCHMYHQVQFRWKIYEHIDAHFLPGQEINQSFPAFVFQTPMSSAISSWQRWRFAGMPKGTRKRQHKYLLSDDFSPVINFSPTVCHPDLTHHESEVLVSHNVCLLCLAQHLVASYVIELHHCVLEAFFKNCTWYWVYVSKPPNLSIMNPKYFLTSTNWCTASPNIAHTGQHLW